MLRFPLNEKKALEALVVIAAEWPGITAFYASKAVFLADREHLSRFGRPVVGDRYIAMDNGPVPSAIYDWFKGNIDRMSAPQEIIDSIEFRREKYTTAHARRKPDLNYLSPSDVKVLKDAVEFCKKHTVDELIRLTHDDPAWQQAELNTEMDPALMIQGKQRDELMQAAKEFAAYGVG